MTDVEYESVRVVFDSYSHSDVQTLLKQVVQDFGNDRSRWYFRFDGSAFMQQNQGNLLFFFRDPHDAVLFGLKYSR